MKILILIVIAIIAYLFFKKFIAKNHSETSTIDDSSAPGGDPGSNPGSNPDNNPGSEQDLASTDSQLNAEAADNSSHVTSDSAAISVPAGTGSAVAAVIPNSGNQLTDIQEMFKILNLRSSDAPRLSITREQYDSIKSGQAADLSGDILDNIMGRLTSML